MLGYNNGMASAFPINIDKLLKGKTVEWERLEFKESWNPQDVIHSVTAFANDINNWGGGYIVVGIREKDGRPELPPIGVKLSQIDKIQKELLNLCNAIKPPYFPIAQPVEYMGKTILLIWVPGSETRPHQAPKALGKQKEYRYYIRRFSSTVIANQKEIIDLIETSAKTPFDDQINQAASLSDISLPLIQSHLAAVGSTLLESMSALTFPELCRKMNIVSGPDEYLKPRNIGLLLFNSNPAKFFPGAKIDIVQFKDSAGSSLTEKSFVGPVQQQLQDALIYIKNTIIAEKVLKVEGRAEAMRAFNYPFSAIEEALVNTVYHRSYSDDSPIELRIHPDRIELISYPGPLPPLNKEKLRSGTIAARKYRNRRLGDFLKELHLTEGRGTGIPTIINSMATNGSPPPIFDTDDDLTYFTTTLFVHPAWGVQDGAQDGVQDGVQDRVQVDEIVLTFCIRPKKRSEIMGELKLFHNYKNYERYIKPLVDKGWLTLTLPEKPTSKNQQYRTTPDGMKLLNGEFEKLKQEQSSLFD